jgi:hypothetical protein
MRYMYLIILLYESVLRRRFIFMQLKFDAALAPILLWKATFFYKWTKVDIRFNFFSNFLLL